MTEASSSGRGLPLPCALSSRNVEKVREIVEVLVEATDEPLAAAAIEVGGQTAGFLLDRPAAIGAKGDAAPRLTSCPDVEETGATLEENARIKASALAGACGVVAIADDTGLEVDALGGEPGVRSARYAGERAGDHENVRKLLHELDLRDGVSRAARFATVAVACWPDGREVVARGTVEGRIATAPRGDAGFGYDPVFVPDQGDGRTFAEMRPTEKHALSHRGRAFRALVAALGRRPEQA